MHEMPKKLCVIVLQKSTLLSAVHKCLVHSHFCLTRVDSVYSRHACSALGTAEFLENRSSKCCTLLTAVNQITGTFTCVL